jgi:predicted ATP-dependent protease
MILQKFISENPHKEIIIIDEIDKMQMKDQEGLLTMMERGKHTSTKIRNIQTFAFCLDKKRKIGVALMVFHYQWPFQLHNIYYYLL